MKKVLGVELAKHHIGMLKRIINIWKITIKALSYIYWNLDANNLYGWAMSQKLAVNDFKRVKKNDYQNLMKIYKKLWWKW